MAPEEKDKNDIDIEGFQDEDGPAAAHEGREGGQDFDMEQEPGDGGSAPLSAIDAAYDDDFDQDIDIEITGDENIDFADDIDDGGDRPGGGFKKILAPALVLVIAAGAGGYIVMNPQILGSGGAVLPEPEVTYRAPDPKTFSTEQPAGIAEAESSALAALDKTPPQPTVNQNEIPRGPDLSLDLTEFAEVKEVNADPPPMQQQDTMSFDLTEPRESEPPSAEGEFPEVSSAAGIMDESGATLEPIEEGSREYEDEIFGRSSGFDNVPRDLAEVQPTAYDDVVAAPVSAPPAAESFQVAQVGITQEPQAKPPPIPPAAKAPEPAPGSEAKAAPQLSPSQVPQSAPLLPSPEVRSAADVYFDGAIPTGPMGAVGPRKVDPTLEPASQLVVVKKAHEGGSVEATLAAANRALQLQRYESAMDMFDQLYAKNPRDLRILMGRAVAQQNVGLTDSAVRSYEEILAIDPKNADAMLNMLGLIRMQYPSVALRRLADLYRAHPDHPGIAAQIGVTHADMGQYEEALRYLGIAATLEPRNAQHVFNMAIISDHNGQAANAIRYYEQALELDAVYSGGRSIPRESVYDRLATLRRR